MVLQFTTGRTIGAWIGAGLEKTGAVDPDSKPYHYGYIGGYVMGLAGEAAIGAVSAAAEVGTVVMKSPVLVAGSRLFGNTIARKTAGFLNHPGALVKVGWSKNVEEGSWVFRVGIGRSGKNINQAGRHIDLLRVPFSVSDEIIKVFRGK